MLGMELNSKQLETLSQVNSHRLTQLTEILFLI